MNRLQIIHILPALCILYYFMLWNKLPSSLLFVTQKDTKNSEFQGFDIPVMLEAELKNSLYSQSLAIGVDGVKSSMLTGLKPWPRHRHKQ